MSDKKSILIKLQRDTRNSIIHHDGRRLSEFLCGSTVKQSAVPILGTISLWSWLRPIIIGISISRAYNSSQQRITKLTNDKQASTQYTQISSPITSSTAKMSTTVQYPPGFECSPRSQDRSRTPSLDFEPDFQTFKLAHISSTKDTEKRRQQNRNSQIAHRQRNKKLIEDLRQELTDYSVYSQDMYQTLQSLRETTKALVSTIDQALSMHPPKRNDLTKERKSSGNSGMSM